MTRAFNNLNDIQEFVNQRLDDLGQGVKAVGWGDKASQHLRFDYLTKDFDFNEKSVMDIGCGLGDFIYYLINKEIMNFSYFGIDLSDSMIEQCNMLFDASNIHFHQGTIFNQGLKKVDVCILSGALSYKFGGALENAEKTMAAMFDLAREGIALNFLSTKVDFELEKNQHYDPEEVLGWAHKLSKNVTLYEDYPLYEFTVVIKK